MPRITKRYASNLFIITALLSGCNSSTSESITELNIPQTLSVNTITLTPSDHYMVEREYVGTVQAGQQANLGFELGGKISQILVDEGDTVNAGDPLVVLDIQLLQTQADQLIAQQAQVTAQLELVEANLKRQKALRAKGFSAEAEIDSLNSQRNALRANYRQLAASYAANQLQQHQSTIFAPYSGIISSRYISKGDVVNIGSPTLTLLASTNKEAHIGIPAKHLARFSQQSLINKQSTWSLRISTNEYLATLLNPGAKVDLNSRTVKLRFALPEAINVIDGELAYLQFEDRHDYSGYWVPLSAMTDGLRGVWNVYALNKNGNELRVERRSVQVLYANNEQVYITGAISPGEKLVADGLHRLVPGQTAVLSEESRSPKKFSLPLTDSKV